MQGFKSRQQAQTFLSIFDIIDSYFHPKKHKLQADEYRRQLEVILGYMVATCCIIFAA
jgi:transposase-like protein